MLRVLFAAFFLLAACTSTPPYSAQTVGKHLQRQPSSLPRVCYFCRGYAGPGGPCYAGPGGPAYAGPGGACYAGPGGPGYNGPGGSCYDGPGGPAYDGPGGPCYSGPGGNCYSGPGGTGENCPDVCFYCAD
jgi:hypothetical protein